MAEEKNPHGGYRRGAGRKPKPRELHHIKRVVSFSVDNDRFILSQQRDGEAYSQTLDRILSALREPIIL